MQKSFDVPGPAEIEVRLASGEIQIDPTLEGRVEVELIANDEESQRLVDDARVELHDRQLLVDVPQRRGGGFNFSFVFGRSGVTCRIRCPHGSGLSAKTKSADVECLGTLGGLSVATASGDVEADRVSGGVNVKSASGDVSVREIGAGVNIQTASGDIDLGVVRGAASVTTASGDVSIEEAYDNVSANTVSGDQDHRAVVRGSVSAHSVSGDVTIGVRRGSRVWLDCNTVSGDTSSELELTTDAPAGDGPLVEIRAKTVSGDITIRRAPALDTPPAQTNGAQEVHA
jgi:Putative adhesin